MNIPGDIPKILASEEVKILKGIFNDYVGPYLQRKFFGQMEPTQMTEEEAAQKAEEDFPPASGDDYDYEQFK
jgi:hypothetical protein